MNIIIIGCGKVGTTLAEQLVKENHNVVMVDNSLERVQSVSEDIDAIKLVGNGASIAILMEAGVQNADILIAVTGSDELNLLCCLIARKAGSCHTIARVRNPVYSREINFIKENGDVILKPSNTLNCFNGCVRLEIINAIFDLSIATSINTAFNKCNTLKEIRFVNDSIKATLNIGYSSLLSNASIQSIIDGLADLTGTTSQTLTLHADVKAKLTETQISTITSKNWTLA